MRWLLPSRWRRGEGPGMGVLALSSANISAAPHSLLSPARGGKGLLALILLGLVVLTVAPAFAAPTPKPTPLQTVQALYSAMPRPTPPELLSRTLRALMRKDLERRERKLDFEWRAGGEESPALTDFKPRMTRAKGDAATVEASFYNHGERRFRRFFLIREGGRWVLDDALLVPENGKLQDFLKGKG